MQVHGIEIHGNLPSLLDSSIFAKIEQITTPKQWDGIKGIYIGKTFFFNDAAASYVYGMKESCESSHMSLMERESSTRVTVYRKDLPLIVLYPELYKYTDEVAFNIFHELKHHEQHSSKTFNHDNPIKMEVDADVYALEILKNHFPDYYKTLVSEQVNSYGYLDIAIKEFNQLTA